MLEFRVVFVVILIYMYCTTSEFEIDEHEYTCKELKFIFRIETRCEYEREREDTKI